MSATVSSQAGERLVNSNRRSFATLAAFVLGVPMAVGILALIQVGPLRDTEVPRYVSHPVENVEVLLFCCALGALLAKLGGSLIERAACRQELLPYWSGQPEPVASAGQLLDGLRDVGRSFRNTYLVRRLVSILDFVSSRGSANELDDQIRTLADNDAMAVEGSYSLVRFITWAIPILGFLGTVLGITESISNVTPDVLEKDLGKVTGGLSLAFDATAVALALTMVVMFLSFLIERLEQGVVEAVDRYVDEHLTHRFERSGPDSAEYVAVLRQNTKVLLRATEQLVQNQADLWARTMAEAQERWLATGQKQQAAVTSALEAALERTLESHAKRVRALEQHSAEQSAALLDRLHAVAATLRDSSLQQQGRLTELVQSVTAQAEALTRLDAGSSQVLRLQEALHQNLAALAGSGAFEQAVNSLTAAIHLLTARSSPTAVPAAATRLGPRPGTAA